MTYNFDPDRWYENQRRVLDGRRARGELSAADCQEELDRLEARYDQMSRRLDAPFELSGRGTAGATRPLGRLDGEVPAVLEPSDTPRIQKPPLPE